MNPNTDIEVYTAEQIDRKLAAPLNGSFEASSTQIASTTASLKAIQAV